MWCGSYFEDSASSCLKSVTVPVASVAAAVGSTGASGHMVMVN